MPTDTPEVRRVALGFDERVPEHLKENLMKAMHSNSKEPKGTD
jgi:hypothetical protein